MNVPLDRDVISWPRLAKEAPPSSGVAHGTAGHGSVPCPDNALLHLAMAVGKLAAGQPPMRLNHTTRTYVERLATISAPAEASRYNHVGEAQSYFAAIELPHNSILGRSVVPTMLNAGFRSNVIPSEAEATLDIRGFYAEMKLVINDARKVYAGAITLPAMLTGATDMAQLRAKSVNAYGFGPVIEEKDQSANGAHSDNERLQEFALYKMVEFVWNAVIEVAASK